MGGVGGVGGVGGAGGVLMAALALGLALAAARRRLVVNSCLAYMELYPQLGHRFTKRFNTREASGRRRCSFKATPR